MPCLREVGQSLLSSHDSHLVHEKVSPSLRSHLLLLQASPPAFQRSHFTSTESHWWMEKVFSPLNSNYVFPKWNPSTFFRFATMCLFSMLLLTAVTFPSCSAKSSKPFNGNNDFSPLIYCIGEIPWRELTLLEQDLLHKLCGGCVRVNKACCHDDTLWWRNWERTTGTVAVVCCLVDIPRMSTFRKISEVQLGYSKLQFRVTDWQLA